MSLDISKLQKELQDKLADVERQRQAESEKFAKDQAARVAEIEAMKAARKKEIDVQVKAREDAAEAKRKQAEDWERAERARKEKAEREVALAEQARLEQERQVKWIKSEIDKIEHAEEERKRTREMALVPVEIEQGEITTGVHGLTPNSSEMSDHLKRLLRQIER